MLEAGGADDTGPPVLAAALIGVDCCNGADGLLLENDVNIPAGKPKETVVTGDIRSLNDGATVVAGKTSSTVVTGCLVPFPLFVGADDDGCPTLTAVDVSPVGTISPGLELWVAAGCVFIQSRTLSTP